MPLRNSTAVTTFSMRVMAARERASPSNCTVRPPSFVVANVNGGGILAGAAKEKAANPVSFLGIASGSPKNERAGAIAEESPEFPGDTAGSERAAMNVSGDDGDDLRLSRCEQRLGYRKGMEQAETSAADVQRSTILADQQPGMKLRGKRRVVVMCFAAADDPIQLMRSARGATQRFFRRVCAERQLVFTFGCVSQRFDASAAAEFADGHAESAIDFLGRNHARTHRGGRPANDHGHRWGEKRIGH